MDKVKKFFGWIVAGLLAVIGVLVYYITLKNKTINSLRAKIALVKTEREADMLEAEIIQIKKEKATTKKEVDEISKTLVELNERRKEIREGVKNNTPKENLDYWNND